MRVHTNDSLKTERLPFRGPARNSRTRIHSFDCTSVLYEKRVKDEFRNTVPIPSLREPAVGAQYPQGAWKQCGIVRFPSEAVQAGSPRNNTPRPAVSIPAPHGTMPTDPATAHCRPQPTSQPPCERLPPPLPDRVRCTCSAAFRLRDVV